jgi:hypothetical protein
MGVCNKGNQTFLHLGLALGRGGKLNFPPVDLKVALANGKRPMQPKASKRKRGK